MYCNKYEYNNVIFIQAFLHLVISEAKCVKCAYSNHCILVQQRVKLLNCLHSFEYFTDMHSGSVADVSVHKVHCCATVIKIM